MKRAFVDQMKRVVTFEWPPQRIVSLVPSQTELLFALGAAGRVVGVTDFCTEPPEARTGRVTVGGTKRFLFERIAALRPDLVIGNREENYREGIERLERDFPVWISDILTLEDALGMIEATGELLDAGPAARELAARIGADFDALPRFAPVRTAYLIWKKPWMAAGPQTFIDDMLRRAGCVNVFTDRPRYPEFALEELGEREPQLVLLSSEPFPFVEDHARELRAVLPAAQVLCVDAMPFSWYGSRLLGTARFLRDLRARIDAAV